MKGIIQNKILAVKLDGGKYFEVFFSGLVEDEATARLLADALTQFALAYAPDEALSEVPIDKWGINTPKSVN